MKLLLARPRGFCAGVKRAIEIVERVLDRFGPPVYVRHEVVHNRHVVEELRAKGAVFVEQLADVPDGVPLVFSAHGVPRSIRQEASRRGFTVFDATCPLVTRVHREVQRWHEQGRTVVMIGHHGHPEVEGTMGQVDHHIFLVEGPADVDRLPLASDDSPAFVTQTTLSVDDAQRTVSALRERFPGLVGPGKDDICYATQNRQDAVKELARRCELILVVGSANSSNSNRLREVAEQAGSHARLVDGPDDLDPSWLDHVDCVGLTAGASAPELLVRRMVERLRQLGADAPEELGGNDERTVFALPRELQ